MEKNFQEGILWWAHTRVHSLGLSPLEKGAMRLKWTGSTGATVGPEGRGHAQPPGWLSAQGARHDVRECSICGPLAQG